MNTCLIRTVNGVTINIKHDTDLPRPYSRINLVQGTRGIVRGYPAFQVCLEGETHRHRWQPGDKFYDKYDHPLWKKAIEEKWAPLDDPHPRGPITPGAVWNWDPASELRGGDLLEDTRLIQAMQKGLAPDYDVYDAVTWSAIAPLSEKSVANRSETLDFPDFTRGKWKTTPPLKILGV